MNVIAITGNLCKDIDLKYTKNGKSYVENTVGVKKEKKDEEGKYESDFIDFVTFEKKADYLKNYAKKGDKIEITGKLRVDNWKDDLGASHSRTYVVADKVNILTSRLKEQPIKITDDDLPF